MDSDLSMQLTHLLILLRQVLLPVMLYAYATKDISNVSVTAITALLMLTKHPKNSYLLR